MQPLRAEHFRFFAVPAEDRDAGLREEIRGLLIDLWAAVGDRLPEGQRSRLGEIYAGPIKATQAGAWAQTRREQGQDAVNLTIEISADQIDINVVGGTKPQAAQLEAWLRRRGAGEFWRASPDLELVFYRRSAHKKGARPVWQGARWELIRAYPASALARKGFSSLRIDHERDLDGGRTEHLAYHLSKKWARDLTIGSPAAWLDELAQSAEILIPVAEEANSPRSW